MSTEVFSYKSVHDFLDEVLGENPSHDEIKQAKKAYWKKYNSFLKRERRKVLKCVHLSLSQNQHKEILRIAENQGVSLYQYLREVSLNPKPFMIPNTVINKLEEISLKLQDLQEEVEEEDVLTDSFWQRAFMEYEKLRLQIEKLKKQIA